MVEIDPGLFGVSKQGLSKGQIQAQDLSVLEPIPQVAKKTKSRADGMSDIIELNPLLKPVKANRKDLKKNDTGLGSGVIHSRKTN